MSVSTAEAKRRAREIVSQSGILLPPVPVAKLARDRGIVIQQVPLDDELSGMAFVKENRKVIVVNAGHHPNRQRFTMAHEFAHHVLHYDYLMKGVHVDKAILHRDSLSSAGTDRRERAANAFAAELLMPEPLLEPFLRRGLDFHDQAVIERIANAFQVSSAALQYRLYLPATEVQRKLDL